MTFGNGSGENGYSYSIFGQYIYSKYSDSLIKRYWELIFNGHSGYEALDFAFQERNSNLKSEFCEFLPWLYYTGSRAKPGEYFELARKFPQVYFRDTIYSTSSLPFIESGNLKPYEFRFIRVLMPSKSFLVTSDTFDLIFTNCDTHSAIILASDLTQPYTFTFTDNYNTGFSQIGSTPYYFQFAAAPEYFCSNPITNQGENTKVICYAFPNPFVEPTDDIIYFPATGDAPLSEKILLSLYTSDLKLVYYEKLPVTVINQNRVLIFNPVAKNVNLSNGVYIYKINGDTEECTGKIAIIKSK